VSKKLVIILILLLLGLTSLAFQPRADADNAPVYVVPLEGQVEKGLFRFLSRAFREAERNGAAAIILEINTYGGMIDAASDISDLIMDSPVPVYAYVRYRAISAGAYIALSCRSLYMRPGSTIGAAEPRSIVGGEETVDEKTLSAWEAEMRKVAAQQGKDPQVAAAMVRREIEIEGVVSAERLLTLTYSEALDIGFTDGVFASRAELLSALGLDGARVITIGSSPAEGLARFLTRIEVATILITIAIAALAIEVMTAGFGVAGIISILAFAVFFGGHIVAGLAGREVVFLFLLGVVLLLIEALLPNFGVVGLAGIGVITASVVMTAETPGAGLRMMAVSLFLSVLIIMVSYRYLRRTGLWSQIVLQFAETREQGYVGPGDATHLVGLTGRTLTPLRPAGVAEIEGTRVDVVSEGGFVAQATAITVVATEGTRIVVRPLE
jgi:membrane-bound serine protease (ClpP class)